MQVIIQHYGSISWYIFFVKGLIIKISSSLGEVSPEEMAPVDTETLLEYIEYNDADELSDALTDEKVDPNVTNSEGWSLLHIACKLGMLDCIEVLVRNPRIKVNIKGPKRTTPLFFAIESKQLECAKLLLAHKNINVNCLNDAKQTPLHYAIANDRVEFVKLLISHPKINLSAIDGNRKTVYDIAKESQIQHKKEILEILGIENPIPQPILLPPPPVAFVLPPPPPPQPVVSKVKDNDKKPKTAPVNPNLAVNQLDKDGEAPLHWAAHYGNAEEMKKLLAITGIDVNIKDTEGKTPLHIAADNDNSECVKLLLAHPNIDVNILNIVGNTALHYATFNGNAECVKLLLEYKDINVNIKNNRGKTPLADAQTSPFSTQKKQQILQLLIQHGATW